MIDLDLIDLYILDDFINKGWTIEAVVYNSVRLSSEYIGAYRFHEEDVQKWVNLRKANSDLFVGAVCLDKLVGHLGGVIISSEELIALKNCLLDEKNITEKKIEPDDVKYLYIPTIVIKSEYRSPFLVKKMIKKFVRLLSKYKNLEKIMVDVFSREGENLASKIGFEFIRKCHNGGKIFELDVSQVQTKYLLYS